MDTNGAAAQLDAVNDDVVMLTANRLGVADQLGDVLLHRRGERVMAGVPAIHLLVEHQQRELDDPEEIELVGRDAHLAHLG